MKPFCRGTGLHLKVSLQRTTLALKSLDGESQLSGHAHFDRVRSMDLNEERRAMDIEAVGGARVMVMARPGRYPCPAAAKAV